MIGRNGFVFLCAYLYWSSFECTCRRGFFILNEFAGVLERWEGLGPNGEIPDFSIETMQIGLDRNTKPFPDRCPGRLFSTTPVAPRSNRPAYKTPFLWHALSPSLSEFGGS